jgi:hypothetical protein
MGLNMSALVKLPAMDIFARPIDVTPIASQPGVASYRARGYYSTTDLDVQAEDGSVVSDQRTYIDIRAAEFAVVPSQRDVIDIPADGGVPAEGRFEVISGADDGGGLATLIIRRLAVTRP